MNEGTRRRLAAILAADVVGYSSLMSRDETATLAALRGFRREVFEPAIAAHRGTLIKSMGDGWLVEFSSSGDGVSCAIRVQQSLADNELIRLRIGLHIGDVTFEDEDIFGDGVNIAVRLQNLAEPGAIVISDTVRRSIDGKLAVEFNDLGLQKLKNITEPIGVYGWGITTAVSAAMRLSAKPSIAVLPFDNMSGDPDQEYFADGITEDIITILSRFRTFFIPARNSTFAYKGAPVDIKQVSRDLGVQYVIEGSVRKGGNRVRITAQLIEAVSGNHVWADRFDRELEDIFAVQDEITERVVAAVAPEVVAAEIMRAQQKNTKDLSIWDAIMRARWHLMRFSRKDSDEAKRLLIQATEQDQRNVVAWSDLAWCHAFDCAFGWSDSVSGSLKKASEAAKAAISLDRNDSRVQTALGIVALFSGMHNDATETLEKAIALNLNEPLAHGYLGLALAFAGEGEAAMPHLEDAMRLSPRDHFMIIWYIGCAWASFSREDFTKTAEWLRKAYQENPRFPDVYTLLAANHAYSGDEVAAKKALADLLELLPGLTLYDERLVRPFKREEDRQRLITGLQRAGLAS